MRKNCSLRWKFSLSHTFLISFSILSIHLSLCPAVCPSFHPHVHLLTYHFSNYPSIIHPLAMYYSSIYPSTQLHIHPPIHPFIHSPRMHSYLPIRPPTCHPFICPLVHPLFISPPIHISTHSPTCPFTQPSIQPSSIYGETVPDSGAA